MARLLRVCPRLPVADLKRTVSFYGDILGFRPGPPWPEDDPEFVMLSRDGIDLQFYRRSQDELPIGPATIYIDTDDAQSLHAALQAHVPIDWGPEVYWYGRREFAFKDPDDYAVIISEETDDPPTVAD
ncbi:VOC family protein [Bauldia sp.]|uniref:VOC family protein n=1 Tax=Bauldia sp. TaxID=2575872 RepID=UPI003BAC2E22